MVAPLELCDEDLVVHRDAFCICSWNPGWKSDREGEVFLFYVYVFLGLLALLNLIILIWTNTCLIMVTIVHAAINSARQSCWRNSQLGWTISFVSRFCVEWGLDVPLVFNWGKQWMNVNNSKLMYFKKNWIAGSISMVLRSFESYCAAPNRLGREGPPSYLLAASTCKTSWKQYPLTNTLSFSSLEKEQRAVSSGFQWIILNLIKFVMWKI